MRRIVLAALALAGCAHRGPAFAAPPVSRPHVIVRQPEAVRPPLAKVSPPLSPPSPPETPRPRHCRVPGAPPFPDADRDITGSTGLIERVQRLHQGRDARIVYERELAAAIKECSR